MNSPQKVYVWDLPLRLFHWALVGLVCYAWYSVEILEDMDQHFLCGYAILTLLLFRVAWGFWGAKHALFRAFIKRPKTILNYLRGRQSEPYLGHNPLGAISVILMLALLLTQAISGLFSDDEYYYFGPLTGFVSGDTVSFFSTLHHQNVDFIIAVLALHVGAILYYELFKKQRLVKAMITGRKDASPGKFASLENTYSGRAALILSIVGAIVYGISQLGG